MRGASASAPSPKSVSPLYRVGDRLLTDAEWNEHAKMNKGRKA